MVEQVKTLKPIAKGFGNYSNQIVIELPTGERIQCDYAIASEIAFLNMSGIKTFASCSGHGKYLPNVAVGEEYYYLMEQLGYTKRVNKHGVDLWINKDIVVRENVPDLPLDDPENDIHRTVEV